MSNIASVPQARPATPPRTITLRFPVPVKQTEDFEITLPVTPFDIQPFTTTFRERMYDILGGREGEAFVLSLEKHISQQLILKQIIVG